MHTCIHRFTHTYIAHIHVQVVFFASLLQKPHTGCLYMYCMNTYIHAYVHTRIHTCIHTYRKLAEAELKVAKADRDVAKSKLHILKVQNIGGVQLATAEE